MPQRIIIAGGGFSGAMALANLVRHAAAPLDITLADPSGRFAEGAAYGTRLAEHSLNVRTERMGAFADDTGGFLRWLRQNREWQAAFPGVEAGEGTFLPRALYALYLRDILENTLLEGTLKGHRITLLSEMAMEAGAEGGRLRVRFSNGEARAADHLVLATGNALAAPPFLAHLEGAEGFIGNFWDERALPRLESWERDAPVVIMGTGLTAVDVILTLARLGFSRMTAFSRSGLFPTAHADANPIAPPEWAAAPERAPRTAPGLLSAIRAAARAAPWRAVIDSLRHATPALWGQLPEREKKRVFRRLFTFWNIHRHRMPEASARILASLREDGALTVLAARLGEAAPVPGGLRVALEPKSGGQAVVFEPARLIVCTGPGYGLAAQHNPLLDSLLAAGLVTPSPLGMGLALDGEAALSPLTGRVHPIGPLRLESALETTAVPELRVQAQTIAKAILGL